MILTKFNQEKGILQTNYQGVIKLRDYLEDIKQVGLNNELPRNLKILTDATDARFEFGEDDIPRILEYKGQYAKNFEFIREALVQNDPYVTALSMIYQYDALYLENFQYKIFSSFDAACHWLSSC